MSTVYKFRIDTCHLSREIDNMFDEWIPIDVELSDDEVTELLKARETWFASEEFKKWDSANDEEYFLYNYVPNIHQKVRKVLEEQAPSIWGEKIMPELFNVDIYLPEDLDWMELEEWESIKKNRNHMKMQILMDPDYGSALFWDESGCNIGDFDCFFIGDLGNSTKVDLTGIDGLKEWFLEWDVESLYHPNHWTDSQWKNWWERGLKLAKEVKTLMPENVDLLYFTLQDPIWKVRPEEANDGGLFNYGEPMKIQ